MRKGGTAYPAAAGKESSFPKQQVIELADNISIAIDIHIID
jgi:hypothetical protein